MDGKRNASSIREGSVLQGPATRETIVLGEDKDVKSPGWEGAGHVADIEIIVRFMEK